MIIRKNNEEYVNHYEEDKENSIIINLFNKYKTTIIALIVLIIIIVAILLIANVKNDNKVVENYLTLNGNETVTVYKGTSYDEPGYEAYNSKNEDLSSQVEVDSNLNIDKIGTYEITYTLYEIILTRIIEVVANPNDKTEIILNAYKKNEENSESENKDTDVYLLLGDEYIEPGYEVVNSLGKDLNDEVTITGTVDTSKIGTYELTYSLTDPNEQLVSVTRNVVITDIKITLTQNTKDLTNKDVTINVKVEDEYFKFLELPNKEKAKEKDYNYTISDNGRYTFIVHNDKGLTKSADIEIKNIDKIVPTGSCVINHTQNESYINISANDESGIKNYIYNNKTYTTNKISISSSTDSAKITIYDKADNKKDITCTLAQGVYINSIQKDGVIVTVNTKNVNSEIAGYYFSYTNQKPNKNTGGYIATSKSTIDVVRLPGTTYIWVEGKNGQISAPKTINITNDALLITTASDYTILQNMKLSTYLSNKGWSITELNNLMARSVRAAGLYTKEAAATSAVSFLTVLSQKYKIKLPYWNSGKRYDFGADSDWGTYREYYAPQFDTWYYYYGLDCSGFTTWAYVNAGYNVSSTPNVSKYPAYWWGYKYTEYSKTNGNIGDFIINPDHVKLIVGKTDKAFITAEAKGKSDGIVLSLHEYSKPDGYRIQKGEELMNVYNKYTNSQIPTGY